MSFAAILTALISLPPQLPAAHPPIPPAAAYVPERVFDTSTRMFVDFEMMLADLAKADVVFVGEQHDDPNTHRLEAALLDGLLRRKVAPVLSLEMFERDVQPVLDGYLAGRVAEEELIRTSRPWPRYSTDYRSMVELAKRQGWTVVASNVPRRIASAIAKSGRDVLDALPESERALSAKELECPLDGYFDRFAKTMTGHPAGTQTAEEQRATTERFYWAQCVKDETMAESIVLAFQKRPAGQGPVVHYNGAFHSDFTLGTASRVIRRLPGKRAVVVSMLPVDDLDALAPSGEDLQRAQYLVYTAK
jgi:uncharacterized iron-regulated protein